MFILLQEWKLAPKVKGSCSCRRKQTPVLSFHWRKRKTVISAFQNHQCLIFIELGTRFEVKNNNSWCFKILHMQNKLTKIFQNIRSKVQKCTSESTLEATLTIWSDLTYVFACHWFLEICLMIFLVGCVFHFYWGITHILEKNNLSV